MTNISIEISPEDFAKRHSNLLRLLRYIRRRHIMCIGARRGRLLKEANTKGAIRTTTTRRFSGALGICFV
jgi:hypothetical protein